MLLLLLLLGRKLWGWQLWRRRLRRRRSPAGLLLFLGRHGLTPGQPELAAVKELRAEQPRRHQLVIGKHVAALAELVHYQLKQAGL